jgi:hypothetical protein
VLLSSELGRFSEARRIADGYIRRRAGHAKLMALSGLLMQARLLLLGGTTRAKFNELRDKWLADNPDAASSGEADGWIFAYAAPAVTREEATSALAASPAFRPLIYPLHFSSDRAEAVGRTYYLAGHLDEGAKYLKMASTPCLELSPMEALSATWASFELGVALEERGDTASACTAYDRVLARWGSAKPPSLTAAKARARKRALGCTG